MKKQRSAGFYERVEKIGNKIPNPMVFFVWFAIIVIVLSWICSVAEVTAVNPATGKVVTPYNLLSREGIVRMLVSMVSNFQTLSVLGPVLVCMFGVGICERSGLFRVVLQKTVESSKGSDLRVLLVFTFVAVLGDAAGGTGYVVMPILGAALFASMGKPAVAGALCGYATVSGAFCANLLLTNMDVVNAGFTVAAARTLDADFNASPAMTYFFSITSVFILTGASLLVTTKIVEPRLRGRSNAVVPERQIAELTAVENRGLRAAGVAVILYVAVILAMCIPSDGWLRNPKTGELIVGAAPFMQGLPFFIAMLFFIPGVAYGFRSGRFKDSNDLVDAMGNAMVDMGPFVALCFVMAQFLAYFSWSNLATIMAIKGAEALSSSGLPPLVIMLLFILLCAFLNLFVGSASAKWGLMSSVFVPMFMLLGYHPAVTQMCFRIGDAASDPITPAYAYFAMLLSLCKKYDKEFGFGALISNMLPYALTFLACYMIQFIIWFAFKIPLGPGVDFKL